MHIEIGREFVVIATLMHSTRKMLLPIPQLVERGKEIDSSDVLVRHFLTYKKYKSVANESATLENKSQEKR